MVQRSEVKQVTWDYNFVMARKTEAVKEPNSAKS